MWLGMIFLSPYVASGILSRPSRNVPIWNYLKDALPTEQAALIEDKKLLKSGEAKIKTLTADIFFQNLSLAQKKKREGSPDGYCQARAVKNCPIQSVGTECL